VGLLLADGARRASTIRTKMIQTKMIPREPYQFATVGWAGASRKPEFGSSKP